MCRQSRRAPGEGEKLGRGVAGELAKKKKERKKIPNRGKNREKKGIERELKREIERAKGVRERERGRQLKNFYL